MKNYPKLYVIGIGGAYKEISKLLLKNYKYRIVVVIDNPGDDIIDGKKVLSIKKQDFFDLHHDENVNVAILLGDPKTRKILFDLITSKLNNVSFPSFNFSDSLNEINLNQGNIIMPGCIFTDESIALGSFNYFNYNCFIAHNVNIDSFNTFSPYVKVSGYCTIYNENFFGTGCILFPGLSVNNSDIGAGAVVKKKKLINQIVDIPKSQIYDKR